MMKILLITNKSDITIDFVVKELLNKGVSFYRLNTEEIGRTVKISLDILQRKYWIFDSTKNLKIDLLMVKSIYFRRPEINTEQAGLSEGEASFIRSEFFYAQEGLYKILGHAKWINDVAAIRNAENKIFQLILANNIGFSIPPSLVTNDPGEAILFYHKNNDDCIIKPIRSGLIQALNGEEGVVFTSKVNLNEENIARIESNPTYLQALIHKKADIRITVVKDKLFSVMIHSQEHEEAKIDWRKSTESIRHTIHEIPLEVSEMCFQLTKNLNLNFAAIDMILDEDNNYWFLEINPNGQWAWIEKKTNHPISETIVNLLIENAV